MPVHHHELLGASESFAAPSRPVLAPQEMREKTTAVATATLPPPVPEVSGAAVENIDRLDIPKGTTSIIWDIETGPQAETRVLRYFDPDDVAIGNLKDPKKIEDKKRDAQLKLLDRAALDAKTGVVLAIGYRLAGPDIEPQDVIHGAEHPDDERKLLRTFGYVLQQAIKHSIKLVGFNIYTFDLVFLQQRSWILRTGIHPKLRTPANNGQLYWNSAFVDLRKKWQCGGIGTGDSLSNVCDALGIGRKNGSGADFAKLWNAGGERRREATDYLRGDLDLTHSLSVVLEEAY